MKIQIINKKYTVKLVKKKKNLHKTEMNKKCKFSSQGYTANGVLTAKSNLASKAL